MSQDMILTTDERGLLRLLRDLAGWQQIQIRYLTGPSWAIGGEAGMFNIHLSKKQVMQLGQKNIQAAYGVRTGNGHGSTEDVPQGPPAECGHSGTVSGPELAQGDQGR